MSIEQTMSAPEPGTAESLAPELSEAENPAAHTLIDTLTRPTA